MAAVQTQAMTARVLGPVCTRIPLCLTPLGHLELLAVLLDQPRVLKMREKNHIRKRVHVHLFFITKILIGKHFKLLHFRQNSLYELLLYLQRVW